MTGFGNSITTITVPVESLTELCRATWDSGLEAYACTHCTGTPTRDEAEFQHGPNCIAAEVWAWAQATGGPARRPIPTVMTRIAKALGIA